MLIIIMTLVTLFGAVAPACRYRDDHEAARWLQIATYRRGAISHLTPMFDGDHAEDEFGECSCSPRSDPYPLGNGRSGTLFVHRLIESNENKERVG